MKNEEFFKILKEKFNDKIEIEFALNNFYTEYKIPITISDKLNLSNDEISNKYYFNRSNKEFISLLKEHKNDIDMDFKIYSMNLQDILKSYLLTVDGYETIINFYQEGLDIKPLINFI